MNGAKTTTDQKKIYNSWEKANSARFVDALKGIVTFDGDETKWDTIVKGVKITKVVISMLCLWIKFLML